ncbi:PspC domain-containing protein [Salinibacterium sp.]|uniref:PspC domain-containing protein n=1 Tax=Salinibacterium sp. TaxID=1915057 RepID=UPI00286BDB4C|nr:PspC domain-containing protein [Salinibacterium sp.]
MAAQTKPDADRIHDEEGTAEPTPPPPTRRHRFFGWMRSLGIQRQAGWAGGVCSGVAARLDIDPLIVRGMVVVVAILGGPAFIIYAAAWLLLPDEDDTIHLENLGRGRVESPIAGIGALVVLSMLPMAQGFWYLGSSYWGAPAWGYDLGRALWTIVLLGAVVTFVVWIARRAGRNEPPTNSSPVLCPATTDGRPETIPEPTIPDASASSTTRVSAPPPAAPAADASTEELIAWRERQALWKQQNRDFKSAEAASQRVVRRQRAAEYRARARASSAESAERRRLRRLANPVLSAPTVLAVVGAAILGGGLAAAAASLGSASSSIGIAIGFAVAAVIMGTAIIVGGVMRHRSGFLAFLAGVTLMVALVSTAIPTERALLPPIGYGVGIGNYVQPFGTATVTTSSGIPEGTTDILQGNGSVSIGVEEGTAAIIQVASSSSVVTVWTSTEQQDGGIEMVPSTINPGSTTQDGVQRWEFTVGDPDARQIRTIRIWQNSGYVEITDNNLQQPEE